MARFLIACTAYLLMIACCGYSQEQQEGLAWLDCVMEAQKNHPDLISASEAINQTKAGKDVVASGLYPQLNSNFNASTEKVNGRNGGGSSQAYSYGVSASQLLFDAGTLGNSVKAAEENVRASQFNYRFVSAGVRHSLRLAFIDLLRAQELVKINNEIYKIRKGNCDLIRLRYESGMEHKGALLTGEAQLADAEFRIRQAQRAVLVAQRSLVKEMGGSRYSPLYVKGDFTVLTALDQVPDFDGLADGNPQVLQLAAEMNAARYNVKSAKGRFWPQLSASAGASRSDTQWPPGVELLNAGVQLSFPLFEGGLRVAELKRSTAVFNQSVEQERSGRDSAIVALEQTWQALADAIDATKVSEKFLIAAEERAKIAEAQYATGFMSYDDWSIIEDNLVNAKEAYLDAQSSQLITEANWIQAKGDTLEYVG